MNRCKSLNVKMLRTPGVILSAMRGLTAGTVLLAGAVSSASEPSDTAAVAPHPGIVLGEVSVTAIKGGDSPNADEAVTYIGSSAINSYDIVNLKQAAALAPNFYMPAYGSRMTSSVYVRGLGTRIDQPSVGFNIDNIPIINKDNFDFDLADIDRVEILRGPQNILYGRNTMGGLINIYTLSPLSFQGVKVRISYGNHNTYRASAGIYGKLSPKLGMSVTGDVCGTDGFYKNAFNNTAVGKEHLGSIRWKTAFRPKGNVVVENTAIISRANQHGYPYQRVGAPDVSYNDTCYYKRFSFVDGLTVKHSFQGITFSSIMSYQYLDDDLVLDQDFTDEDYFTLRQKRKESAFTADFVARGPQTGVYSWLAGVFGFYKHTKMEAPVTFFETGIDRLITSNRNEINPHYPIFWDSPDFTLGSDFRMPAGGFSVYHESQLHLGDFTATLGLRYDWERTRLNYRSSCNTAYTIYDNTASGGQLPPPLPLKPFRTEQLNIDERGRLKRDFNQLLPKLSLSYRLPETLGNVYASATKGYKSGGYNTQMFSDFLQQQMMAQMGMSAPYDVAATVGYKPETTWNYEVGAHLAMLDARLTFDLAAFWINVDNQQVTIFPPGSITGRLMANAGKSRSRGVEISASYTHPWGWFARGSYGFTDARFVRFDNGRQNYAGCHLPYAPENTLFVGAGISRPLAGWIDRIDIQANVRGVGRIYWDEANTVSQPFYALLNASAELHHRQFSIEIWANNLTSTQYATFYFVSIGNTFLQRGNDTAFGVTLRYNVEF